MRYFVLLATIYAATLGTSYGLVDAGSRPPVEVTASAYDKYSCTPDGCIPENTLDRSTANNSRWSCKGDLLDSLDEDEGCWIEYYFEEPQDVASIRIAFYKGTYGTLTLDVYVNGSYYGTIESSGTTSGFETFYLDTNETVKLKLKLHDPNSDKWLSIKEVKFMVR